MPVSPAPRVTLVRRYGAPVETVFSAWVRPDLLSLWWGGATGNVSMAHIEPKRGGNFLIGVRRGDGSTMDDWGYFTAFDANELLEFTWRSDTPAKGHVTVQFLRLPDGSTEVSLVHFGLPNQDEVERRRVHWEAALDALGAYLAL